MSKYTWFDDSGSPLRIKLTRVATAHFVRSSKAAHSIRIPYAEFVEEFGDVEEIQTVGCSISPGHDIQRNYIESAGE